MHHVKRRMANPLTPDSFMECPIHGRGLPAFICQHLQHGSGLGFFTPSEAPTPDDPWQQAWCAECERVAIEEGKWNDESEGFASFRWVCESCFEVARERNA
jgi:hypothetical protein